MFARVVINYCINIVYAVPISSGSQNLVKYLLNKTSVGNKEWVCQTCSRCLMKNRVPPCSIANGMAFPVKPDFFDLNE